VATEKRRQRWQQKKGDRSGYRNWDQSGDKREAETEIGKRQQKRQQNWDRSVERNGDISLFCEKLPAVFWTFWSEL
jgi:hypothetical protein